MATDEHGFALICPDWREVNRAPKNNVSRIVLRTLSFRSDPIA
jgi:hypothetical protein